MLEQAILDLTTQVAELNRLMAQLVSSTADTVETTPKRARRTKSEPAAENPTPTTPSAPAAEAPATAQPTEAPPASPSEEPPFTPDPTPASASSGAMNDSAPSGAQSASGASTGDHLALHLKIKAAAMRLAAVTSKERVMTFIKDKFHAPSLAAIPDDAQPAALAALESELTKAQQGLKEAA